MASVLNVTSSDHWILETEGGLQGRVGALKCGQVSESNSKIGIRKWAVKTQ